MKYNTDYNLHKHNAKRELGGQENITLGETIMYKIKWQKYFIFTTISKSQQENGLCIGDSLKTVNFFLIACTGKTHQLVHQLELVGGVFRNSL